VTCDGAEVAAIVDGMQCRVVAGTHKGKAGTIADRKSSKGGHVTVTVRQDDGVCFKTLARNVTPA
jgi:ribosomal protein S4E